MEAALISILFIFINIINNVFRILNKLINSLILLRDIKYPNAVITEKNLEELKIDNEANEFTAHEEGEKEIGG